MSEYMDTPISWGSEYITEFIPKKYSDQTKFLNPPEFSKKPMFEGSIEEALENVLNNPLVYDMPFNQLLKQKYKEGHPIVFAVDDSTRPNHHTRILLPLLIDKVLSLGVKKEDIRILVACGTHRFPREEELPNIVGEKVLADGFRSQILPHDCKEDVTMIGVSDAGTPMGFNNLAFEASILIPLTDSELHYFAGVAGTIKEICPGIASCETVRINHPKMFDRELGFVPECKLGNTKGNPVISDIKNMVTILKKKITIFGIDAIVTEGEIVYLNAGDLIALHEEATKLIVKMRTVKIPKSGDIVIIGMQSWGINLYQAGKGIHAAWNAVKQDGKSIIIAVAPLADGIGNVNYEKAMQGCSEFSIQEALEFVLDNYCTEDTFKIGNQKPVDTLRIMKTIGKDNLKFVADWDPDALTNIYRVMAIKKPDESPSEAIRRQVEEHMQANPDGQIYIMDDPGLLVTLE